MEIIQHGKHEESKMVKTFRCSDCGCIFKADDTEYEYANRYEDYYYCQCPDCLNIATEVIQED